MADLITFEQIKNQTAQLKNYVDDKTDDGYIIKQNNLTFRDSNEIIISGVNATKNDNGTVDGVTISGGKVILSPDIFGQQDIKLEKASGIYRGYELELEAGTELTAPVYTPSVLSANNGVVIYQTHSQTEGYIFNNDNSVTYGENITQKNCTISGLQSTLTVDNGTIEGMDFDYDNVTIAAEAVGNSNRVTVNGSGIKFTTDNGGENFTVTGSTSSDILTNLGNNTYISVSTGNDQIVNTGDTVTIYSNGNDSIYNTGDYVSINSGNCNDTITNTGDRVTINSSTGDDSIYNTGGYVSIQGSIGIDSIYNTGGYVSIQGGSGNDSIYNTGDYVSINSGSGNDTITNTGNNVSINSSIGADTITNEGDFVSINSGDGADSIYNTGDYVSIQGGTGDDTIYNSGTNITYQFSTNDGTNTITGFNQDTDILYCSTSSGTFNFAVQDNDILVTIGSTTVLLQGISSGSIRYKIGSSGAVQTYTIT